MAENPLGESATAKWGNRDEPYSFPTKHMKESFVVWSSEIFLKKPLMHL